MKKKKIVAFIICLVLCMSSAVSTTSTRTVYAASGPIKKVNVLSKKEKKAEKKIVDAIKKYKKRWTCLNIN